MAAVGVVVAMVPGVATAGSDSEERVVPKVEGLDGPRGLAVGPPRRLVYSQADGSITQTVLRGDNAGTTLLGEVEPQFLAPAVSQWDFRSAHILTVGGPPGSGGGTLYRWKQSSGEVKPVADVTAYQVTDPDPYDQEDEPTESNPYGVASLEDGSALVADAAGNDLLRVWPNGDIVTVARIKPRVVRVGDEFADVPDFPPPGTPITSEAVATSVTVGADGAYYVGELRGFPSTVGTSQVWRIEPDSVDAVCNPKKPDEGACTRYADGFTSIQDLAAGPDGELYVLELVKAGWLQWEVGIAEPIGGLFRIPPGGGEPDELAPDRLTLPGGVAVSSKGRPFNAGPIFGEGAVARIR